ncbi:30S ribosomal protein S2 [candidate division KSB1 bacterium]|nr:MAG: 30S ribosomal protein S2 [candidate division KSB1 bacterium]
MAEITLQQLLMSGAHFGHLTRRWNPKMKPYIFMERNGIYIIDLNKTLICLKDAMEEIKKIVARGEKILFVGTKKQAKDIVRVEVERCNMPYVTDRWLGGMLTNFTTIKKSIKHLKNLEKMATDSTYEKLTKKEILQIERKKEKLEKSIGGIKDMNKLPGGIFIVDTKKEAIAVAEANKLNIPIFGMLDTNCDPDPIDYPIPVNDDAFKSISLIVHTIADTIIEAQAMAGVEEERAQKEKEDKVPAKEEEK